MSKPKPLKEFIKEQVRGEIKDNELVAEAERRGYIIHRPVPQEPVKEFDLSSIQGERLRVAVVSDTHLGSKYQQITHLRNFYRYARKRRVDCVIGGGDMTDGPGRMHKGQHRNIFLHEYDSQRDYAVETIPDIGVPQFWISGNHDESYMKDEGGDIVRDVCSRREDLEYIGQSEGYVQFGDVLFRIDHPHDGMSYALSYKLQKRIEALSPEHKPHILCLGNYHKVCHVSAYRNVEGFILPAFQAQTPFMASKALASIIGGLILEFGISAKGLAPSLKVEWVIERVPIPNDWPGADQVPGR